MLIRVALQMLFFLVLGFAVLSWIQPSSPVHHALGRLTEPLLAPLRRVVPTIGGIDLSAFVLMLILQIGLMLVG
jgi:YggT family protein